MKKLERLFQLSAMCALAVCMTCAFTACSSDDGDDDDTAELPDGFRLTGVGYSYASFEISKENLRTLFWKWLGTQDASNADLSAFGIDNDDIDKLLVDMFYISFSETADFSEVETKEKGEEKGDKIIFVPQLRANTKYYYRIFCEFPSDDQPSFDGRTYELNTKTFDPANVHFALGRATVSYEKNVFNGRVVGYNGYVYQLQESTITVDDIDEKEGFSFGMAYSESATDLDDDNILDYILKEHYGYKDVVWYYPMWCVLYGIDEYDRSRGMKSADFRDRRLTATFEIYRKYASKPQYYRAFATIGGEYVYDELRRASENDKE